MNQIRVVIAKQQCKKKIVYNLSSKSISSYQEEVLGNLGLDFQLTPKVFPIVDVIQATEVCCQEIEKMNPEVIEEKERAHRIRHTVVNHIC